MPDVKTSICIFITILSLSLVSLSAAQTPGGTAEENISADQTDTFSSSPLSQPTCAEQCAIDRHAAREQCDIIYDIGLCFGLLTCIDDTEAALSQCIDIAHTIFSGCASRCYRELLEGEAGE